jgi:aminoglycoside phosphotransferase (APT) family kinase protein
MARSREAKAALGPELGRVILDPVDEGESEGLSYAILPYRTPLDRSRLTGFLSRKLVAPAVLEWLRRATAATLRVTSAETARRDFGEPLEHLAASGDVTDDVRAEARQALERLRSGAWSPAHVLMHGDLWVGNILLDHAPALLGPRLSPEGSRGPGFVVIDWGTARVAGHAIYDLVRVAHSFRLVPSRLQAEIEQHCRLLDCALPDARSYLLAALGQLGMAREHMPLALYQQTVSLCQETLAAVDL